MVTHRSDREQAELWNGIAGRAWVDGQALLDEVFRPIEKLLVDAIAVSSGSRVLDVGCGTGGTTLAAARRLDAKGGAVGIDVSEPMIAAALARAERQGSRARFIHADAQTYPFEPASFDTIISRFGVMFFDDPANAFANLRRAATDAGALRFVAWRSADENPFMTTAECAAAGLLPVPGREPGSPGQFAFADRRRVERILEDSDWGQIDIRPIDVPCTFPEKELVGYFTRLGPLGRLLHTVDERTRTQVIDTVRPAFDSYVRGDEVHFNAACWMVGARGRV
jgi:SAM-dependent methyltransferase